MTVTTLGENRGDALAHLLSDAKRFPMLSPERERELAVAWRDYSDEAALRELVGSHLRLVIKIARSFAGYGLLVSDLIAEGNVGLMQAAQKFDPDRGFRFATYAMWWIRAAIQEHILHSTSIVKMGTTAAQKKLFFNLRQLKGRLEQFEAGDLSPELVATIAAELDVPEKDVVEMNRRMSGADGSIASSTRGRARRRHLLRPTRWRGGASCSMRRWSGSMRASARSLSSAAYVMNP